jgi:hypothetical protein
MDNPEGRAGEMEKVNGGFPDREGLMFEIAVLMTKR